MHMHIYIYIIEIVYVRTISYFMHHNTHGESKIKI